MRTPEQIAYEQRSKRLTLIVKNRPKPKAKAKAKAFVIEKANGVVRPFPKDLITYK